MLLIKVKDINVNMVQSLHTSVRQTSNLKILVPDVFYFARKHHVQLPLWRKLLLLFNAVMTEWATLVETKLLYVQIKVGNKLPL